MPPGEKKSITVSEEGQDVLGRQVAADLLSIGAVLLRPDDPFTWSSGLRAPIYCDNRLTMIHPPVRRRIARGLARIIEAHGLAPEVVVGTATAGIPHAAWLAERLDLPMAYARGARKAHGRENRIEGRVEGGQRAVVVEDLVSTGGSAWAAVEALRATGAEVTAVLAIFSYGLAAATRRFAPAAPPLYTLTDLETLLSVAREEERLDDPALKALRDWRRDPEGWAERNRRPTTDG